ncbi:hypothetical protein ACLKMH_18485 [Psychromonas sp. KJ10-10]|uniref:hypothetical protein n=1 Tax=Psychromonas sp. KJ10-10 TaxID=3391823 RepID=UPI0039B55C47
MQMNKLFIGSTLLASMLQGPLAFAEVTNINQYKGTASVSQGATKALTDNLFDCESGYSRIARVGEVTSSDGLVWQMPASNQYTTAPKAFDLYEQCTGVTPSSLKSVYSDNVPVVTIDEEGEEVTGYIFADNYFELYINGKLIAVDSVPFTPFNSSIVKFKVSKPYTIAVKVIDWEENLGLGSESNRGSKYHPGDGGFIASFSDGTVTSGDWLAQTFYTSPIFDFSCLSEKEGARLSENCSTEGSKQGDQAYALHWKTPDDWMAESFDASGWPKATLYTERVIGVNNKNAYMNFKEKFSGAGASFIWSTNVVLDNEVLLRYTVK